MNRGTGFVTAVENGVDEDENIEVNYKYMPLKEGIGLEKRKENCKIIRYFRCKHLCYLPVFTLNKHLLITFVRLCLCCFF
jgi:hypothetical protein